MVFAFKIRHTDTVTSNREITKFALSDDGIDYSMFNVTDTRGPDYYDASILAQPVLETLTRTAAASEDGRSSVMKTMQWFLLTIKDLYSQLVKMI